jgi:hypothetical protein
MTAPTSQTEQRAVFAPSELIFLNGEKYAREISDGRSAVSLLHVNKRVSSRELAHTAILAAILANEQPGNISLHAIGRRSLLGRRGPKTLSVEPGCARALFPLYSLESFIPTIMERGPIEASELVFALLREYAEDSHRWAIDLVQGGLAARGIIEVEEVRQKGIVTASYFRLTDAKAKLAARQPLEPVSGLLKQAATGRPEIFRLLEARIELGLAKRQGGFD